MELRVSRVLLNEMVINYSFALSYSLPNASARGVTTPILIATSAASEGTNFVESQLNKISRKPSLSLPTNPSHLNDRVWD